MDNGRRVTEADVELLREFFAAFNRGDLESAIAHLSPDWEYRTAQMFPDMEPVYRGREGFATFWRNLRDPWESITAELERAVDLGDRVLELHNFHGKVKESGIEVTQRYANIFTFRDGLVSEIDGYGDDWAAALEAAGLSSSLRAVGSAPRSRRPRR
jgi:ketosteroid isomerase-like protein